MFQDNGIECCVCNILVIKDIYHNDDYYDSVLTGYEIKKNSNQNITDVQMVCGKVRVKLTNLLTMGKV